MTRLTHALNSSYEQARTQGSILTFSLMAPADPIGPHSSLTDCYQAYMIPRLEDRERKPKTFLEYEQAIAHWERLMMTESGCRMPVKEISDKTAKLFRKRLLSETPTRSKATVNKIMRHWSAVVRHLWPADRTNPKGKGLIAFFDLPGSLEEDGRLPFTFARKELSDLYRACDVVKPLRGCRKSPIQIPLLWRLALVLEYNIGARTYDLFTLKWSDFREFDWKWGSIHFRAAKTRKLQRIPLNQQARLHLDAVKALALDSERIFPAFNPTNASAIRRKWRKICKAAQVNGCFEDLRKTVSTAYEDLRPGVGPWITGHQLSGVNARNYQNPTKRVLKAVYTLKQPKAFIEGARLLTPSN